MKQPRSWKAAQLRARQYRTWMIRMAGLSFWLAIAALLLGGPILTQLMIATLTGAITAWGLADSNAKAAVELRNEAERRKRGPLD